MHTIIAPQIKLKKNNIMTIYLINDTHTYNDITNELKNIKTGKMIKIAAMRVKCLEYMLNHAQQEIIYKRQLTNAPTHFGEKEVNLSATPT